MSKQSTKNELLKLKGLTDATEAWARRVNKFWESTQHVCLEASNVSNISPSAACPFHQHLKHTSKAVAHCVGNVRDVAHHRFIEMNRLYQEKNKSKQKNVDFRDFERSLEAAMIEISTAIFSTFPCQMDQMDRLHQAVLAFQRQQLEERTVFGSSDSGSTGLSNADVKKRELTSDENNVEIDWDAFDRELEACADVVDRMGERRDEVRDTEENRKLREQLKQSQRENGEWMRRALIAERSLERCQREKAEWIQPVEHRFSEEDFLEVKKALRKEQMARLEAEQRLKDAHEEIKAAQFAYKVAKAVASRIVDSSEAQERNVAEPSRNVVTTNSFNRHYEAGTGLLHEQMDGLSRRKSVPSEKSDETVSFGAADSNPFVASEAQAKEKKLASDASTAHPEEALPKTTEDVSNPFMASEVLPKEGETVFDAPPRSESLPRKTEDDLYPSEHSESLSRTTESASNPFLVESTPLEKETTDASNPFLVDPTNPFYVERVESAWNPFSTSTNPFLA